MRGDTKSFGTRLRLWRERRGMSQLALAAAANVSQRHLSFLESDRTRPSRDMVLRLGAALEVPLRQQNALLLAAGFAPAWRESDLAAPELEQLRRALDRMLRQHEPYPAFVVDRRWKLLQANEGAARFVRFLLGAVPAGEVNLAEALVSPAALRPFLENFDEVARYFLRGVQADAAADGTAETAALLKRLLTFSGMEVLMGGVAEDAKAPVLSMDFRKDETRLRLFTTIATLGTPLDVTVQELRIEFFFPADNATEGLLRAGL